MEKPVVVLALLLAALSAPAAAQLVPAEWDAEGRFSQALGVAPGKFVEICDKLPKGTTVAWSFEAAGPLDFNVHYHEGRKVRLPVRKDKVAKDAGSFVAKVAQDYCWMWTNPAATDISLRLTLHKR